MLKLLVLSLPIVAVQACSSPVPNQTDGSKIAKGSNQAKDSNSNSNFPKGLSNRFSTSKIKEEREAFYTQKRIELTQIDPSTAVRNALRDNNIYLMAIPAGRGGATTIPGLSEVTTNVKCSIVAAEGLGDSIYGENHMQYRRELLKYMREFNTLMSPHCT